MKKRTFFRSIPLLIIFQLGIIFSGFSQYGNEWIQTNQSYYKIPVGRTGFYALSFAQLRNIGLAISPSGIVQPSELQLFHRGVEQAMYVRNDSLFFYGKMNDGTLDSLLYEPYNLQVNKNINLYSDTTAYFLTWASGAQGKRMATSALNSATVVENYHWDIINKNYFEKYNRGLKYSSETWLTQGDRGEGWTSYGIGTGGQKSITFPCPNAYTSGPNAILDVRLIGENGDNFHINHNIQITIQGGGRPDTTYNVTPFSYFNVQDVTMSIPASYFANGSINVLVKNAGSGYASTINISHLILKYPQTYFYNGTSVKEFNLPIVNSIAKIQIDNVKTGSLLLDISNSNTVGIIPYTTAAGKITASAYGGSKLLLVPATGYLSPASVKSVKMPIYTNKLTANYIIITHKKIISSVVNFAKYRASAAGGGYDTLIAEVNNIYDMFSYGEKSPVGVRKFLEYISAVGNPEYVFIMGKGLEIIYDVTGLYSNGDLYRLNPSFYINNTDPTIQREDLIPPYGYPNSDLAYVAGLNGSPQGVPGIAIGRLAAQNGADVDHYLSKIIEHESAPNELWKKNFLHLSGGHQQWEKDNFFNYVNSLKLIAEDTIYSGKVVRTITKLSSGSVDNSLQTSIADVVNSGVSHITSFGHTTPDFTDIDFGFASMDFYGYRNKGKYPLLYTNGCYSGQIFGWSSFAEDWVKTLDRGAIASIGHTHVGYINELQAYTTEFYRVSYDSREMIGKPIGDVQLRTIKKLSQKGALYPVLISTLQQMALHGDPAVKIYMPTATDLLIDDSRVTIKSFDGKPVTAISDSFALQLVVDNLGLDFNDSLEIKVRRTINGKLITYGPLKFKPVKYRDTILFVIKSPDVSTYGENIFEVYIDSEDKIAESDEMNNLGTLRYFMPLSGVVTLFPKEFSIVNSNPVQFIAQSTNLLTDPLDYYIEIDTSYLFNSIFKRDTIVRGSSIIRWNNFSLPYQVDSTVYYWRVRYNVIPVESDTLWGESSFIYINNSPEGWSQSEFPQFFKDGTSQINRDVPTRSWDFSTNETPVFATCVGSSFTDFSDPNYIFYPFMETVVSIYNQVYTFRDFCDGNAIIAVAFSRITGKPYVLPYGGLCEGVQGKERSLNVFTGLTGLGNQNNLKNYINAVPTGDAVLLVSTGDAGFSSWDVSLKDLIRTTLGSDSIMNLTSGRPFILLSKKGATKPLKEYSILNSATGRIQMDDTILSINKVGYITSTLIGPATSWGTFYHDVVKSGTPQADKDSLMIIGVDMNGLNVDTIAISQKDSLDLSQISQLNSYPYIRLLAQIEDSVDLTPANLTKWQVIYSGVPEGTMNASIYGVDYYKKPISVIEGDTVELCYAFENISNYSFLDTLRARATITNSSTGAKVEWLKLDTLSKGGKLQFCYSFSTMGLSGNNILQVYVNPQLQRELYYNNNLLETTFSVTKDKTHPVLDVVFDGVHIMNGDIVSPSPVINITLNDENKFQIRNNNEGIEVYLLYPGQTVPQLVTGYTGRQIGKNGRNSYQIEYNPTNLPDGKYTLIVRAKDVAGNASGTQDYSVEFEVVNESTITNFYPYPNPFSSNTRFVFTVTGNEIPKDIIIQIMTVSGKVVREITEQEIGPLRIGNNKTEYAWDGTDEFGDRLANGVYLYRVLLKNADTYKHRTTAGDKAFKKDWGKLYILR